MIIGADRRALVHAQQLVDRGHIDKAVRRYEVLLETHPNDDLVVRQIADLYEQQAARDRRLGRAVAARDSLRRAIEVRERTGRMRDAIRAARTLASLDLGEGAIGAGADLLRLRRKRRRDIGRDLGATVLSAGLVLLASPPWDLWPLALVGLAPLLFAIRRATPGRALLLGWLCGFLINVAGTWWGVELLHRFAGVSGTSGVLVVAVIAAYQGFVFGLWAAGIRWLDRRAGISPIVSAPLLIAVTEAVVPFLFPWYLAICVWRAWPLCQVAEVGGPTAVSALVVLANVIVMGVAVAWVRRRPIPRAVRVAAAVFGGIVAVGGVRAAHVASLRADAPAMRVGIVQPNFGILSRDQRERDGQRYVETLREATERAGALGATLVVWPETSFPFLFDRDLDREYARGHPWELRGGYRGRLLAGVMAHSFGDSHVTNSVVLIGSEGAVAGIYDKISLLVFGEYIPLRDHFPEWARRTRSRLPAWPDIEPGSGPLTLQDDEIRVLPLVCYEDILADFVHRAARAGNPNLLVTVANHAWFGDGAAAPQAMALAMFRGIETRRDLVRSTNTGVTSTTDALGRVLLEGPLYDVPRDEPRSPEVFVQDVRLVDAAALGPYTAPVFPYACAAVLGAIGLIIWRRRRALES